MRRRTNSSSKRIRPIDSTFFENLVAEPLTFVKPTDQQYQILNSNVPLVISNLSVESMGDDISTAEYVCQLQEKLLFLQPLMSSNEQAHNNTKVLNIEFAKLTMIYNSQKEKIGFKLQRRDSAQKLFISAKIPNQQLLKQWIAGLNKYVVRVGSLQKYRLSEMLGEGAQAKVYKIFKNNKDCKCTQRYTCKLSHKFYAVKIIELKSLKTPLVIEQLVQEIRVMRDLIDCGNVLSLQKIYCNEKFLNLFLDCQYGGNLAENISSSKIKQRKFSDSDAQIICAQILLTVDYMETRNIIHRDLKPQNILLHSNEQGKYDIRIADFGFAVQNEEGNMKLTAIICGTPGYIAPEVLLYKQYYSNSDVFSVGAILFNILTRKTLFKAKTLKETLQLNTQCDMEQIMDKIQSVDEEAQELILSMLCPDPEQRPSAYEALQHSWFNSIRVPIQESLISNNPGRLLSNQARSIPLFRQSQLMSLKNDDQIYHLILTNNCTQVKTYQQYQTLFGSSNNHSNTLKSFSCSQERSVKNYYDVIDDFVKHRKDSNNNSDLNFENLSNFQLMNHSQVENRESPKQNESPDYFIQTRPRNKSKFAKKSKLSIQRNEMMKKKSLSMQLGVPDEEVKHNDIVVVNVQLLIEDKDAVQNKVQQDQQSSIITYNVSEVIQEGGFSMKHQDHQLQPSMAMLNVVRTFRIFR